MGTHIYCFVLGEAVRRDRKTIKNMSLLSCFIMKTKTPSIMEFPVGEDSLFSSSAPYCHCRTCYTVVRGSKHVGYTDESWKTEKGKVTQVHFIYENRLNEWIKYRKWELILNNSNLNQIGSMALQGMCTELRKLPKHTHTEIKVQKDTVLIKYNYLLLFALNPPRPGAQNHFNSPSSASQRAVLAGVVGSCPARWVVTRHCITEAFCTGVQRSLHRHEEKQQKSKLSRFSGNI